MVHFLDVWSVASSRDHWDTLNRVLGFPPNPSIQEAPNLELKTLTATSGMNF